MNTGASIILLLAFWLSITVNRIIDFGFGHKIVITENGERLPVRSWRTHGIITAPLWDVFMDIISVGLMWFVISQIDPGFILPTKYLIYSAILWIIVAYSHLFADAFNQAGVYTWKKRIAIAYFRYNNVFANLFFVLIGIYLIIISV